jgi:uncharacterized protein (TIGR03083 family)
MGAAHAWNDLMWEEMADLGQLLHELPDDELDRPSLCDGWRVRDVVGHMLFGHTTPMRQMFPVFARHRFSIPKASFEGSKAFASSRTPDELRDLWDAVVAQRTKKGVARLIRPVEGFVDHTVHHQDIRRPLGRPRTVPPQRLVAALDGAVGLSGPVFSPKKKVAGLRLAPVDLDWSHGEGPEVRGPAEAILMAAAGRPAALADLEGEGVETLVARVLA